MSDPVQTHRDQAGRDERARSIACAVLTISDTRTADDDTSGRRIRELLVAAGHAVVETRLVPDEPDDIHDAFETWIDRAEIRVVVSTGGTGVSPRDRTVDVVRALLTTELEGFGELFRMISYEEIGSAAMLSRALGGFTERSGDRTFLFALPGSTGAVNTAMSKLVVPELRHLVAVGGP